MARYMIEKRHQYYSKKKSNGDMKVDAMYDCPLGVITRFTALSESLRKVQGQPFRGATANAGAKHSICRLLSAVFSHERALRAHSQLHVSYS